MNSKNNKMQVASTDIGKGGPSFSDIPMVAKEKIFCKLEKEGLGRARSTCKEWRIVIDGSLKEELVAFQKEMKEKNKERGREGRGEGEGEGGDIIYQTVSDVLLLHHFKNKNTCSCCLGPIYNNGYDCALQILFRPCYEMWRYEKVGLKREFNVYEFLWYFTLILPLFCFVWLMWNLAFALLMELIRLLIWTFTLGYCTPCSQVSHCHCHTFILPTKRSSMPPAAIRKYNNLPAKQKAELFFADKEITKIYYREAMGKPQPCWVGLTFCCCSKV